MTSLRPNKVSQEVTRGTLDGELHLWLKNGCPSLGGHMSVADRRREHQALVPESKVSVQVRAKLLCRQPLAASILRQLP